VVTDTDGPISSALRDWNTRRARALDEIEQAHRVVVSLDPGQGQPYAIRQIHQAYTVLLASQFQGFCRDLHSECRPFLLAAVPYQALKKACEQYFTRERKLDEGNANLSNINVDFSRFGLVFWDEVKKQDWRNRKRGVLLEALVLWRNAIAHHDFETTEKCKKQAKELGIELKEESLELEMVRSWRAACDGLAVSFDEVMRKHIESVVGRSPW
jgi:hypothetical protein